jgi:CheY-like chemotaxis protein
MDPGSPRERGAPARQERRKQILVVEDELLIRVLLGDALRDEGYDVIEAVSADEALGILMAGVPVDLILSDVQMPGSLDGLDLLGVIRRRFGSLPVVLTSGHLEPEAALKKGATHFVRKPYRVTTVLELVAAELVTEE